MSKDRDIRCLHPSARNVAKFIAQNTFQWYYLAKWLELSWSLRKIFMKFYAKVNSFKMQFHEKGRKRTCRKIFFLSRETFNECQLQNGIKHMGLIQGQWSCPSKNNCKMGCARESFHKAVVHREPFSVQANVRKISSNEKGKIFLQIIVIFATKNFLCYTSCDRWDNRHDK